MAPHRLGQTLCAGSYLGAAQPDDPRVGRRTTGLAPHCRLARIRVIVYSGDAHAAAFYALSLAPAAVTVIPQAYDADAYGGLRPRTEARRTLRVET